MNSNVVLSLTATFVFLTATSCLAQDESCGSVGNRNESRVTARRDQMFYLNTANPALCTGNITNWRVCYYGPSSVGFLTYWATYAVYRRMGSFGNERYVRVSEIFRAVRATGLLSAIDSTGVVDGAIEDGGFRCYNDSIESGDSSLTVQAGDVLGACVFDPVDADTYGRRQLDIVGESEPGSSSLLGMGSFGCGMNALPTNIESSQLSTIITRRLHLYANIEPIGSLPTEDGQPTEVLGPTAATPSTTVRSADISTPIHAQVTTLLSDGTSTTIGPGMPSIPSSAGSSILSLGAIVGLVVGVLLSLGLVVAVILIVLCLLKYRRSPKEKYSTEIAVESNKVYGFDNVTYGAEERTENVSHITYIVEAGVYEVPMSEHEYEATGLTNMYEYATLGPNKEMAANSHYYTPLSEASISYAKLLEKNKEEDIYGNVEEYLQPASAENELYAQLKSCGIRNIPANLIEIEKHLGSGLFGTVEKGSWKNGAKSIPVALKLLKEGSSETDKVKFLQEAAIMAQFRHPNVVTLHGVMSENEPLMLVVELIQKGDLRKYLHAMRPDPGELPVVNMTKLLLSFCQQVALGMQYLSAKGFVHRDLAARNILVSKDNICKVADFGMSRDLADETYYVSQGGKVPVKWTAPEAIHYKKYSTASDVWSYGCLLYEIWSLGYKPFEAVDNSKVIQLVDSGKRLPPPPGCPRVIYKLMVACWNPVAAHRPSFREVLLGLLDKTDVVFCIPPEALDSHHLAGVLGSSLESGENMYKDLQNRYLDNNDDYQEVD